MTIDAHFTIGNNKSQLFARVNVIYFIRVKLFPTTYHKGEKYVKTTGLSLVR